MISRITLRNFGPFRGEHRIDLRPGAYAITASDERDPKRSNAIGKSMFLEAIQFVLEGHVNKLRGFDGEGWITRGEKEGGVRIDLEDGAWISRSKGRGEPRQIRAFIPGHEVAAQDAAETAFMKHLCLLENDFERVSYFEQKEASKMLYIDPADRLELVSGWLGLGLADRAEARAGEIAGVRWREVERLTDTLKHALPEQPPAVDVAELRKSMQALRVEVVALEGQAEVIRQAQADARARELAKQAIADHEALVAKGKELGKWVKKNETEIEDSAKASGERLKARQADLGSAKHELAQRKKVSLGQFDGRCPVADIECPAKAAINKDRVAGKKALDKAQAAYDEALVRASGAQEIHETNEQQRRELAAKKRELENMRAQYVVSEEAYAEAKGLLEEEAESVAGDRAAILGRIATLRSQLVTIEAQIIAHEDAVKRAAKQKERIEALTEELNAAEAKHRVAHRARVIFKTARRRVAEGAIAEIEADANGAIAAVGVDLQIGLRWERETKKLAIECDECGAPFPTSARVKECTRCAAPRGMHTSPKLDFVRSDSSGGFDDLAGIALQLSAGAWLLAKRQSPWATAILDEPTSAMDPVVRRGLVRFLASMTARTYRQMFVVSHSADFVDAIPNRITIVRKASGERAIVS